MMESFCIRTFVSQELVASGGLALPDHRRSRDAQAPLTAAEDLSEIIMRRYERASTLVTSNRPVEDWGKLLGDAAAVSAMLDRLLHHGHVVKFGPPTGITLMWLLRSNVMHNGFHSPK